MVSYSHTDILIISYLWTEWCMGEVYSIYLTLIYSAVLENLILTTYMWLGYWCWANFFSCTQCLLILNFRKLSTTTIQPISFPINFTLWSWCHSFDWPWLHMVKIWALFTCYLTIVVLNYVPDVSLTCLGCTFYLVFTWLTLLWCWCNLRHLAWLVSAKQKVGSSLTCSQYGSFPDLSFTINPLTSTKNLLESNMQLTFSRSLDDYISLIYNNLTI